MVILLRPVNNAPPQRRLFRMEGRDFAAFRGGLPAIPTIDRAGQLSNAAAARE